MARGKNGDWIWMTLGVIGGVIFVPIFVLRILALFGGPGYDLYNIPANSMFPTVVVGDYILTSANVYKDRVPPRGQVNIFKFPRDQRTDYVKRVIGLPGDRIQLRAGRLIVNDETVAREPYDGDLPTSEGLWENLTVYREILPGGKTHLIAEESDMESLDDTEIYVVPEVVPEGHVFVLGDNRDHSSDSRSWSHLPLWLLRDKALFIYWSTDLSRIGKRIE